MNKLIIAAAVGVIGVLFFTACHKDVNTPAGSPAAGTSSAPESVAAPKGDSPVGIWYEQNDSGDRLEITKDKIKYISGRNNFEDEMKYKSAKQGDKILIEPEDFFIYEDISYDRKQDMVIGYTMSHSDGDGGHHYLEFLRVPYIAPPPPVYPDAVDKSDPNAKKDFEDLTVRSMKLSFYDEGMPYDVNSSMAPEPPYKDHYSYDLKVLEDGTGLVSSSFCREIELTKEQVDELQKLVREADLGQINGIDIHTADVPYDAPEYEAEIELASGDIIRSSANWDNVPENWQQFQEPVHHLLFFAFVDAGYHYNGGDFHSTKPMKRVMASGRLYRAETGITEDEVYIKPDWKKGYEYSLDTHYFKFSDPENKYPVLMKTLDALSDKYRKTAEEQLKKDYEMMEKVPKNVWKKADRKYCYSLFAVDQWEMNGRLFRFTVSVGFSNSLGAGDNGYGRYYYDHYLIDAETGEILSLSDLFVSPEAISSFLSEQMIGRYGTHNEAGKRVHRADFPQAVAEVVKQPGPEGIGCTLGYDALTLWMPGQLFPSEGSSLMEVIYYDELQDILSDRYTEVW